MQNGERFDQSGAAFLDFEAESDSALVAYAQVVNPDKGLSFNFPFLSGTTPAMPGGPTHPGPLEAVAWYLNKKTDAFIALQNTTDKPAVAIPTIFVSDRAVSLGQRHLKPREAITIKLPSPYGLGDEKSQRSAMVRVEYKGEPGAVEAEGWVVNDEAGFSAAFTFHRKVSDCHCPDGIRHLYGTGIAIGKGAMMGMAPDAIFSPYLAVGNRSRVAIAINPVLSYQRGDEYEKVLLPRIFLKPQESALVNLQEYQESGIIPSTVNDASIDLQYQGEAGALIAELASVDQDGSFVSPVPMTCNGQRLGEMAFWRTDGDWHSSLSLWNVAAEPMELEIRISHPGGEYEIVREIGPGAAAMVSVNELQQSQEPDGEGRTIPAGVTMGGMSIRSRNQINGLVMNAMLVNPVTKTCAECGSYGYVRYCVLTDDITSTATHKYTIYRGVGENFPMYIVITYSSGFQEIVSVVIVGNTNPSVASGQTQITTHSPGTTTLTGRTFYQYPLDRFCTVYGELETSGTLQVIQVTFQKANGSALPSPFRVGISATTLDGMTFHDRKQSLRAVVTPSSEAANISISVTSRLTLTNVGVSNGVITFDVVGKTKSDNEDDAKIEAKRSGKVIGKVDVTVLVPNNVSATHDLTGTGVTIINIAEWAGSSPVFLGLGPNQRRLVTWYGRFLNVTVCDQFGGLIGDLYNGAEVSEFIGGNWVSINQSLTANSTYLDPVGAELPNQAVGPNGITSNTQAINAWPSATKIPFPNGTATSNPQNIQVQVDGFLLNPSIANRTVTVSGDGQSTTSPPVTVTITWP